MAADKDKLVKMVRLLDLPDTDFDNEPERAERLRDVFDQLPESLVSQVMQRVETHVEQPLETDLFAKAYGISASEMRLMKSLVAGQTVIEHAESLGISVNTARTHMRRLLEKTGSGNQIELISRYYGRSAPKA